MTELEKQMLLLRDLINDHFHAEKPVTPVEPIEPGQPITPTPVNFRILQVIERMSGGKLYNLIHLRWDSQIDDIEYYREGNPEWEHSLSRYNHSLEGLKEFVVWVLGDGEWFFRAIKDNEVVEIPVSYIVKGEEKPVVPN